jgi:hypothetical protein
MKKVLIIVAAFFIYTAISLQTSAQIEPRQFFETDSVLHCNLSLNIEKFIHSKNKPKYLPALFSCNIADSNITEQIRVEARGNVRRQICYMPPMKMNFHNNTSPALYKLGSLKLVTPCFTNEVHEQLLLKEYLIYKMYNLLTDKSFNVRLLNITYNDSGENKKPYTQYAFLLEDTKELAKRTDCKDMKGLKLYSESADRDQMTLVALFEYMIGNTDWGVSQDHNVILIRSATDSTKRPYVVPYDFDYSGLVNAEYAVPAEGLDIENVRQRYYFGFQRTPEELDSSIEVFNTHKDNIYALVNNFTLLTKNNRTDMINYLDGFYNIINNKREVKNVFINGARSQ